jgi:hypothetical protein
MEADPGTAVAMADEDPSTLVATMEEDPRTELGRPRWEMEADPGNAVAMTDEDPSTLVLATMEEPETLMGAHEPEGMPETDPDAELMITDSENVDDASGKLVTATELESDESMIELDPATLGTIIEDEGSAEEPKVVVAA